MAKKKGMLFPDQVKEEERKQMKKRVAAVLCQQLIEEKERERDLLFLKSFIYLFFATTVNLT